MINQDLIKRMAKKLPTFYDKDIDQSVRSIVKTMSDGLVEGKRIEIRGFGSFFLKEYAGRKAINPKTGEQVQLTSRKIPQFRISKKLHETINDETNKSNKK